MRSLRAYRSEEGWHGGFCWFSKMATCITCGAELHPERAETYSYCLAAGCQEKNATGLTIVAVGVNKSAEQFEVLDEQTREAMAQGRYHDQRRASFGKPASRAAEPVVGPGPKRDSPGAHSQPALSPAVATRRKSWTQKQENLVLIYHEQGMRPDEIAEKVALSRYTVTQILLGARLGARQRR
jgi:hypothetical protein